MGRYSCKHIITLSCDNVPIETLTKWCGSTDKSVNKLWVGCGTGVNQFGEGYELRTKWKLYRKFKSHYISVTANEEFLHRGWRPAVFNIDSALQSGNWFQQQHERVRLYMEVFLDSENC